MAGRAVDVRPSDPYALVAYNWGSDKGTPKGQAAETIGLHTTDCMENVAVELSENTGPVCTYQRWDA